MTLLSISALLLFAMLAGVCHHEHTRHRLLLSWQGSRASWKPKLREILERDPAIGDSAGLRKLSSLFEVLGDCFLASLFHIGVIVFRKPMVSFLLHGALPYSLKFSRVKYFAILSDSTQKQIFVDKIVVV